MTAVPDEVVRSSVRQVFVEVNPYHAEILFPYHGTLSDSPDDVVFGHERLFGQPLFDRIPARKARISLRAFGRHLWSGVDACHFNTINATLTPISRETVRLALTTAALAVMARVSGCRTTAVVHEADQFYATGLDSCRRHAWFRRLVGWWLIKLFDERYVLSPEVAHFIQDRGFAVRFLDPVPVARFFAQEAPAEPARRAVAWVGPVQSFRRNWRSTLELDPQALARLGASVSMVCDGRVGEGPEMQAALEARGLAPFFRFRDYRPDDEELFAVVRASAGLLCMFGGPEYGATKSSGARIIAYALRKPYIAASPVLGVYAYDGTLMAACETLTQCVEALLAVSPDVDRARL
ncbi:MAG: hypothetical protein ABUS56_10835 [Acidobacteriota bacterium]